MAQTVSLWGATYSNVPAIDVPKSPSGTARFTDVSGTTATADKILQGYGAFGADGAWMDGTATGGGGMTVVETQDEHGGTVVTITGEEVKLQTKTATPTTAQQTIQPDSDYTGLASVVISAMPSGTAGTPTASKGTVSNHSVTVTPSVTNTTGYITGGTKTGTAVTVSASELVSGSQTITDNGTVNVTNLASVTVAIPIVHYYTGSGAPSASLGADGDIYLQTS